MEDLLHSEYIIYLKYKVFTAKFLPSEYFDILQQLTFLTFVRGISTKVAPGTATGVGTATAGENFNTSSALISPSGPVPGICCKDKLKKIRPKLKFYLFPLSRPTLKKGPYPKYFI